MSEGDTFLNALIGAVVTVLLSFVPLSPVLGGATASYLQGGEQSDALRVGALSGLIAAVPLVLVMVLIASVVPFLPAFGVTGSLTAVVGVFAFVAFLLALGYSVGLGALGGILGFHLVRETNPRRGPERP